jgi:hypothetical protein
MQCQWRQHIEQLFHLHELLQQLLHKQGLSTSTSTLEEEHFPLIV